jgi:tRNA A-37 threonylcarbamoyl transferase component Bud32
MAGTIDINDNLLLDKLKEMEFPDGENGPTEMTPISSGSEGKVLKVRNIETKGVVALKLALKQGATNGEVLYQRNCFSPGREVVSPNLIKIHYASGKAVIMDYIDGGNLEKLIASNPEMARRVMEDGCTGLLGGLEEMHNHSIVHKDLKPANLLFNSSNYAIVIADFGRAKEHIQGSLEPCAGGTLAYVAPEARLDRCCPRKSDVWSLGLVICETILGNSRETLLESFAKSIDPGGVVDFYTLLGMPETIASKANEWRNFVNGKIDSVADVLGNPDFWRGLLGGMLEPDFERRLSAAEALSLAKAEDIRRAEGLAPEGINRNEVVPPIGEAPIGEAPIGEAPIGEAPIGEAPVVEAPIVEAPIVEAPIVEAPIVEAPIVEAPIVTPPVVTPPVVATPIVAAPAANVHPAGQAAVGGGEIAAAGQRFAGANVFFGVVATAIVSGPPAAPDVPQNNGGVPGNGQRNMGGSPSC